MQFIISSKVTQKLVSKQTVKKKQKFKSANKLHHVFVGGALWWANIIYVLNPFTRYNRLSNRLSNRIGNRLDVCLHDAAGRHLRLLAKNHQNWWRQLVVRPYMQISISPSLILARIVDTCAENEKNNVMKCNIRHCCRLTTHRKVAHGYTARWHANSLTAESTRRVVNRWNTLTPWRVRCVLTVFFNRKGSEVTVGCAH